MAKHAGFEQGFGCRASLGFRIWDLGVTTLRARKGQQEAGWRHSEEHPAEILHPTP